ncbi:uncharacterized protein LOC111736651 [Pteropus vampyrus]|uniref:Uncharacterized protein LOC111736651 n=1 Tax=Pteropus vampyrus TaxID=132908 RepID=A0A6P6C8S0_PTEVA|nr:uncharacterized protein LOC111736651 [Pteropus vampyrus]
MEGDWLTKVIIPQRQSGRRAAGHPCPLTESLSQDGRNRKEGGTLSRCLRHPSPGRAPSPAHRRAGSGTSKDKGRETRAKVGPWRGPLRQTGWGLQRLCSQPGKREEGRASRAPRCSVCHGIPQAPGASPASAHPSCALLGGSPALQADGGVAGDQDPRRAASAWRARRGRGAAEREAAGQLLLPGCRMKPVWLGQVVARRAAWRCSWPSQIQAAGASGSPTPLPPPSPRRSFSALSLSVSALLAAGRDRARLDCSAKMRSTNPAVGADTWCRGKLCC